jgi:anthranilate synthase component 2
MRILIIDNYDSFTYNLVQILEEVVQAEYSLVKNDQVVLDEVNYFDKILIGPGPGLPDELPILKKVIQLYSENKSIFGVCLGHQAIVETFGGKLFKLNPVTHGVSKKIKIVDKDDYLFAGISKKIKVGLYHSWAVVKNDLPSCLRVTAMSDDGIIMAIKHEFYDVRGIQFHPESIMTIEGKKILRNWLERC